MKITGTFKIEEERKYEYRKLKEKWKSEQQVKLKSKFKGYQKCKIGGTSGSDAAGGTSGSDLIGGTSRGGRHIPAQGY